MPRGSRILGGVSNYKVTLYCFRTMYNYSYFIFKYKYKLHTYLIRRDGGCWDGATV